MEGVGWRGGGGRMERRRVDRGVGWRGGGEGGGGQDRVTRQRQQLPGP